MFGAIHKVYHALGGVGAGTVDSVTRGEASGSVVLREVFWSAMNVVNADNEIT